MILSDHTGDRLLVTTPKRLVRLSPDEAFTVEASFVVNRNGPDASHARTPSLDAIRYASQGWLERRSDARIHHLASILRRESSR